MRTNKSTSKSLTTGKIWTSQHRKAIRALTKSNAPARLTATRLQSLLSSFRARVKKLAKSSNGKKRQYS
jgi:hypothetical protein